MRLTVYCLLAVCMSCRAATAQPADPPDDAKLVTRWARDVSPAKVHPEYPRPQMVRPRWQNLNGLWDYAIRGKESAEPTSFDGKILVPFPAESTLSGVAKQVGAANKLWYHRSITVPPDWRKDGQRLLLHFGACDWEATVYLNGTKVGSHRGGYDPFSFDITDALAAQTDQKLVVEVWDPTNDGFQPRGKQVREPRGIWYTPTTGIWQTVWIEPVPGRAYLKSLYAVTDFATGAVTLHGDTNDAARTGHRLMVEVLDGDKSIVTSTLEQATGNSVTVAVPNPSLWSPDHPKLYRLRVALVANRPEMASFDKATDAVESYFAFRKLTVGKDDKGITRLMLNDKFVFQYGTLDQGYWPDGLYTAPTDEALRYDLEVTKRLGFNMVRKHVKVEPARWYYHCDQIGLLVWQDMPSGDAHIHRNGDDLARSPESSENFKREWTAIIRSLRHFPSIVMWVPFNEGWGQFDTASIVDLTRDLDPTRWINNASGWIDRGVGEVRDIHVYPGPMPPDDTARPVEKRALVLGEFGGLGMPVNGHTWQNERNWGYRSYDTPEALTDAYVTLLSRLHPLIADPGYSAAVYTQTTDVEIEVNGLMTYDRAVIKMDEGRITAAAKRLFGPPPEIATVVPDARTAEIEWRYTTEKPDGDWQSPGFDDSGWSTGKGGFGTTMTPGTTVRTEWNDKQIWVRRTFELPAGVNQQALHLMMHHDEDAEVYLNGVLAAKLTGYTTLYTAVPITPDAIKAMKPGKNVIAIRCQQSTGGQYIDAGLVTVK